MKIPKKLKIGNCKFSILAIKDKFEEVDFYGRSWTKTNQIKLNINLPKDRLEETFFHEISHIVLDQAGYADESGNEKFVKCLAAGFYQVLKDNNLLK